MKVKDLEHFIKCIEQKKQTSSTLESTDLIKKNTPKKGKN